MGLQNTVVKVLLLLLCSFANSHLWYIVAANISMRFAEPNPLILQCFTNHSHTVYGAEAGRRQSSYMANSDWFFPAVRFQLIIGRGEFNRWWAGSRRAVLAWLASR